MADLRALLAEARAALQGVAAYDASPDVSWTLTKEFCRDALDRLDDALAEPAQECQTCAVSKAFHDVAVKERDYERLQVDRLKKVMEERWFECHDGTEEGCCKSHE